MATTYEGKVNNLITVEDLRTLTGVTEGTNIIDGDITWLKFIDEGKEILVADRCIAHTLNWNILKSHGIVYGKQIKIGNKVYRCRLMTGGDKDPATARGGEWNKLMVNLIPNEVDIYWNGFWSLCQEEGAEDYPIYSVARGSNAKDGFSKTVRKDKIDGTFAWRPFLEYLYEHNQMPPTLEPTSPLLNTIKVANESKLALKTYKDKLAYTLKDKGIEVDPSVDKMSNLLDKVGYLYNISTSIGDNVILIEDKTRKYTTSRTKVLVSTFNGFKFNGSCRINAVIQTNINGTYATAELTIEHKRGADLINSNVYTQNTQTQKTISVDLNNIKVGDIINFYLRNSKQDTVNYEVSMNSYMITCEYELH